MLCCIYNCQEMQLSRSHQFDDDPADVFYVTSLLVMIVLPMANHMCTFILVLLVSPFCALLDYKTKFPVNNTVEFKVEGDQC